MYSLFDALMTQHARQLTPVRCARSTIGQLHRYFEDVVLENNLNALVIESMPLGAKRPLRDKARVRELARGGRRTFFFVRQNDDLNTLAGGVGLNADHAPVILQRADDHLNEHFVIIADARFSALLTTSNRKGSDGSGQEEVIWTFEPDVVYSALEYLMARVSAEHPYHSAAFEATVRTSMPKATSLQLTLSVTTKLAHLLQEQAGREIAVSRIATAIRESLELGLILQTTVDEVGAALNVASCALRVEAQTVEQVLSYFYFGEDSAETAPPAAVMASLSLSSERLAAHPDMFTRDGDEQALAGQGKYPIAVVPLIFQERVMGTLQVTAGDPLHVWQENELLLLRTAADQVAVAINHAGLFAQIQQQALTDALTGCYNRRAFEMQLERDLGLAMRLTQPISLLMLDLDFFKQLNDTAGHDSGDAALRKLSECFKLELRRVDSAARFGGDEFAIILPHASAEGALIVAERLRARIETIEIDGYGTLTASLGIASFPIHGATRSELIAAADKALYAAKRGGRNLVCMAQPIISSPQKPSVIPSTSTESSNPAESIR